MDFFKKKGKTVDLTNKYNRHVEKMENIRGLVNQAESVNKGEHPVHHAPAIHSPAATPSTPTQNSFSFLRDMASSEPAASTYSENEESGDDRKRKLAKRLGDITEKLEELSTQIYHLQQRVELLERKTKSSGFD